MARKYSYVIALLFSTALLLPFALKMGEQAILPDYDLITTTRKSTAGIRYQLFHAGSLRLNFTTTRPLTSDKNIFLCIPGAFTALESGGIDGIYAEHGKISNRDSVNRQLGGAIRISRKRMDIFPTNKGSMFNDSFLDILTADKSSVFQQIQLINHGVGDTYTENRVFQRRAIVQFNNNDIAVIESEDDITLAQFTKDLLEFGVFNALYTDMGAWDEGWYRSGQKTIPIGKLKTQTARQSNWLVLTAE